MLSGDESVTKWLRMLEAGHNQAAQELWNRFFERLVRLVQQRVRTSPPIGSEAEDIALSAFASFFRGVKNNQFPEIDGRHSLWRLLVSIAIHKLLHAQRDQGRLKRGGGRQPVESPPDGPDAVEQIVSREPTPELAAEIAEQYDRWMNALGSDELTQLAHWKLEGLTNDEIALRSGRTTRTVERKLNLIRKILIHELSPEE
jgi:RNA polymerase sigma factor (sigma-70 family)